MHLRTIFLGTLLVLTSFAFSQNKKDNGYQYTIDLTKVVNDKVYVELTPPAITKQEVVFYLPKIVPGTYAIADYGRYVTDITAVDKKGNKLAVEKIETNGWKIKNASKLAKISYWVDDSWDTKVEGPEIFWPAGTNIEENKNYVINTSGFLGYFDGVKDVSFQFNVIRAKDLYGSTGLIPTQTGSSLKTLKLEKSAAPDPNKVVDTYKAVDYDELIDSPLMYSKPDTAIIKVANTEVLIGSYSPTGKVTAKQIAESIKEVLMAQEKFLGGKLPVDKYAFIFYFTDQPVMRYGALEHSYSSMYYMPEMTIEQMNQQLRDFAAHEFFHIVTPLTVHSEEIDKFDFNDPKMSQHLWMYEGVTEYFASLVQVKYDLISPEEFIQTIREKMFTAESYKTDLSFTDLSKFTLDQYHDQYDNVYLKGALIGLCLDLKLRKLSQGKYGLQNLMLDLSKKYGKNKAFKDDELFSVITQMTYPEIGDFFKRYVQGSERLPFKEVMQDVGIIYTAEDRYDDITLGIDPQDLKIAYVDNKPKIAIATTENMNAMGQALKFQEGDVLLKINGEDIPELGTPESGQFFQKQLQSLEEGKTLSYTVNRKDSTGAEKVVELSSPVMKSEVVQKHFLAPDPNATPEQLALRQAWLRP